MNSFGALLRLLHALIVPALQPKPVPVRVRRDLPKSRRISS
jgi:hypothetical protein